MWSEQERPSSSHRIRQTYTGHGVAVPPPLDLGFAEGVPRPPSAPAGPPPPDEAAASALAAAVAPSGRKSKKKPPPKRLLLHVHLREKVLPIQVAEGKQAARKRSAVGATTKADGSSRPMTDDRPAGCIATGVPRTSSMTGVDTAAAAMGAAPAKPTLKPGASEIPGISSKGK